jgi:hypothetical protein
VHPIPGYTEIPFDPPNASPDVWRLYHGYRRLRHAERTPGDPIEPDEVIETKLRHPDPDFESRRSLLVKDHTGQAVSSYFAGWVPSHAPGYESSRHLLFASAGVLGPERRHGIGTMWLRRTLNLMTQTDHAVLTADTDEPDGHAFLQHIGAEEKIRGAENRLELADVDWEMVRGWVEEGEAKAGDTRLVFYENRVPDADLRASRPPSPSC